MNKKRWFSELWRNRSSSPAVTTFHVQLMVFPDICSVSHSFFMIQVVAYRHEFSYFLFNFIRFLIILRYAWTHPTLVNYLEPARRDNALLMLFRVCARTMCNIEIVMYCSILIYFWLPANPLFKKLSESFFEIRKGWSPILMIFKRSNIRLPFVPFTWLINVQMYTTNKVVSSKPVR